MLRTICHVTARRDGERGAVTGVPRASYRVPRTGAKSNARPSAPAADALCAAAAARTRTTPHFRRKEALEFYRHLEPVHGFGA